MAPILRAFLVMLAFVGSHAGAGDSLLLADFPASTREQPWFVVNDGVMGGRSEGGFRLGESALVFSGVTNTNGGGFSSIRSEPRLLNLGDYAGVRLRVRGDGRTYTLRLTTADTRGPRRPSYWADFETLKDAWKEIDVPFRDFHPRRRGRWLDGPRLNPGAVDSLGLMIYDGRDGAFRLEVDWIHAYRAPSRFSMTTLQWQKRPLLIFAADAGDARLRQQLAAIEETRKRFDERDMVLIVVLEEGRSRVEQNPLTTAEADALRASFEVDPGTFALRLVGKDGGVKRRSGDAVPIDDLYRQIDAMPMRQEEMRRRRRSGSSSDSHTPPAPQAVSSPETTR